MISAEMENVKLTKKSQKNTAKRASHSVKNSQMYFPLLERQTTFRNYPLTITGIQLKGKGVMIKQIHQIETKTGITQAKHLKNTFNTFTVRKCPQLMMLISQECI